METYTADNKDSHDKMHLSEEKYRIQKMKALLSSYEKRLCTAGRVLKMVS